MSWYWVLMLCKKPLNGRNGWIFASYHYKLVVWRMPAGPGHVHWYAVACVNMISAVGTLVLLGKDGNPTLSVRTKLDHFWLTLTYLTFVQGKNAISNVPNFNFNIC